MAMVAVSAPRAADLPVGSVVALRRTAWVKVATDQPQWELSGDLTQYTDHQVDIYLANDAHVLRVGDGTAR